MLKYQCLVLDHDDTVVRSAETVNYPQFLKVLHELRPERELSLEDYLLFSAQPGYHEMCQEMFGFSKEEMDYMFQDWTAYVKTHIPEQFEGMEQILHRQKAAGGMICVSSHSSVENITRDWQFHFNLVPDKIYSWELGEGRRKPAPYALEDIMYCYHLQPQELVMIDDLKPGYDMARQCGVDFIAAGWAHPFQALKDIMRQNCDYYLESVDQLENFLFA